MRTRWLALACGAIMLAGCGPASVPSAAGSATPSGCPARPALSSPADYLTGIQFVSAARGWAVSQDQILATTDGGQHWRVQRSGQLNLTSVDFISATTGWAVGGDVLLATSDGGTHWAALPEPCLPIRSVHFISPDAGFAVAGGRNVSDLGPEVPGTAGVVLATSGAPWDLVTGSGATLVRQGNVGGLSEPEAASFLSPRLGWVAGVVTSSSGTGQVRQRLRIVFTDDAGRTWHVQYAGPAIRYG